MKILFNKTKNIVVVFLILLLVGGCDDFLDVNENPNNPTVSTPSLTLPVAQQSFVSLQATSMNYVGNFFVNNWAVPSNWSAMQNLIRYNVTTTFYATIFETSYSSIFKNLTYVENYDDGKEEGFYNAYKVIARAIKGYQYQHLVDLYGDIPYTEANLRGEITTPKYDDEETVYMSLIDNLTEAANMAANMPEFYENPESQDIIFGGDMVKWGQFINTVKLRMLLRLSNTNKDDFIKAEIAKIEANGLGYIDEDVFANPGYSNNEDKQNPYYGYIGYQTSGSVTDRNDYTVASEYALDNMILNNDMRYQRLYSEAANGGYKGVWQATALPGEGYTNKDLSHVGPGLLIDSEQDQIVLQVAESKFLQAEAVVRDYMGGDAKSLYYEGIQASFDFLGVEGDSTAIDYYNQEIKNIGWESSPDKVEAIIYQKALALNGTKGHEVWIELTRTGFPANIPTPDETDGVRPVRLLYPATEVARNRNNVPSQTKTDAFTNNPFWK